MHFLLQKVTSVGGKIQEAVSLLAGWAWKSLLTHLGTLIWAVSYSGILGVFLLG
jgi:hypothetical protein